MELARGVACSREVELASNVQVWPTTACSALLPVLRASQLPFNRRRAAARGTFGECRGCTLGLVSDHGSGRASLSAATRAHPALARALCAALRASEPSFEFTSVQVNLNARYRLHSDGRDAGPSRMLSCGDFAAGRMWLHAAAAEAWQAVDAHDHWVAFDGRDLHLTEAWVGPERYSLVFFTAPEWSAAGPARAPLEQLGFPWPSRAARHLHPAEDAEEAAAEAERWQAALRTLPPEVDTGWERGCELPPRLRSPRLRA